jgi:hypothetical protein
MRQRGIIKNGLEELRLGLYLSLFGIKINPSPFFGTIYI